MDQTRAERRREEREGKPQRPWGVYALVGIISLAVIFIFLTGFTSVSQCEKQHGKNFTSNATGQGCECASGYLPTPPQKVVGKTSSGLGETYTYQCVTPLALCKILKGNQITKAEYVGTNLTCN